MAGRLRLNTNVTQHEYDAVTPTQNKPAQMQYALLDAINLVPRTEERPQIATDLYYNNGSSYHHQQQQQQYIQQPSATTSMFESLAAPAPSVSAPILASAPYPLGRQQRQQFAGEHDAPAYASYAGSDIDTASSAGPGTPASSHWSPASFSYPSTNGFAYGNHVQNQTANNAIAFNHLYSSIYNPGYINTSNPYLAFGQAPILPVQHVLPLQQQQVQQQQQEEQQQQQQQQQSYPPLPPTDLSKLAFLEVGSSIPAVPTSRPSSPETNALYYSSGEESSRTSLSRASSIASIASSTGSRSSKYRSSNSDKKEKKFTCTYPGCDRSFSRNFNLSTHYNTHLGIKPFACTHCDKTFSRRHDCARHIAAVHTPACPKSGNSKECNCETEHTASQEPSTTPPFVNPPSLAFAQMSPFMPNHGVMSQVYDGL